MYTSLRRGRPRPWAAFDPQGGPMQVFSDVDDTILCSGGGLLGIDEACYYDEIYPGVLQFQLELSRGWGQSTKPPSMVILTARPREVTNVGIMRIEADHPVALAAARVGKENGLPRWGVDVENSLYGRLFDAVLPQRKGVGMDKTKYKCWRDFVTNLRTVFVGDNTQGDQSAAEQMAKASENPGMPNMLAAAFIHNVSSTAKPPKSDTISMFDSYIGAAVQANLRGLISPRALLRVKEAVLNSAIVQLCLRRGEFTNEVYPCKNGTSDFFDSVTGARVAGLALPEDGSVALPACGSARKREGKGFFQINRNRRCDRLLTSLDPRYTAHLLPPYVV